MTNTRDMEKKIKQIIDELKGLCQTNGLSNQSAEEEVITSVFLYKFLNDKFMYNLNKFAEKMGMSREDLLQDPDMMDAFYDTYAQDVAFTYDETIESLVNHVSQDDFYKQFDDALEKISNDTKNEVFSVETADGTKQPLFTRITEKVEPSRRNNFAKNIFRIIARDRFDFGKAFEENFDFYATIFEYLIKDYNVASGVYAEFYTPIVIADIISSVLAKMTPLEDKYYEVYDPSAGSGSLVLHLANALGHGKFGEKAIVYTQDISAKSTRFLRINLLLNGLTRSLGNIVQGDTLLSPAHHAIEGDQYSDLKQYDFIVSNPPFKMDFSSTRNDIERKWESSEKHNGLSRFFAGLPKVPNKKKESMAIYTAFIQHILWSLKPDGKAAIVVPTGFITAQNGIEKKIRQTIIDNHWLKGVISFPSNIFANTGTNVSVLFIDKSNQDGNVELIDASKMGTKEKDGKNQRTVLSEEEVQKIENTFINQEVVDEFSVSVTYNEIKEKNYSLAAGQYFEIQLDFVEMSENEFKSKLNSYQQNLEELFDQQCILKESIFSDLKGLKYGN